jgi:hypothetical protein
VASLFTLGRCPSIFYSTFRLLQFIFQRHPDFLSTRLPFTAMGVTKNYVSSAHMDRDVLHSVISWFIQGILYFCSLNPSFALL